MVFDPLYLVIIVVGMVISGLAQLMVMSAYKKYQKVPASSGMTGAQAAAYMLQKSGVAGVGIEQVSGMLSDHYDPTSKVLRLSPDVYGGRSLASIGIACHEAGHALQHAKGYTPLYLRSALVPVASIGSNLGMWLMVIGAILGAAQGAGLGVTIAYIGFAGFASAVLFSFVTLPVEFDASNRAKAQIAELGLASGPGEQAGVAKVLNAAALTYVAAAVVAFLQLIYWAYRLGLFGGRRE